MVGRHRDQMAALVVLVVLGVCLSSVSPLLLQRVINDALPHHRVRELTWLCTVMITTGVLAGAAGIAQGMIANRVGQGVVHDLRVRLYDHMQGMGLPFFADDANTEIQARLISDIGGISDMLTLTAQGGLTGIAGLVTACAVMLVLNWPLALASIAFALVLNLVNQRFARRRSTLATRRQAIVSVMMRLVAEDLSLPGVILARTLGQRGRVRDRFWDTSHQLGEVTYQQRLAGRAAMTSISMILACLPPVIYLLAGTVVPRISLGTAVVLATMQSRLTGPIQQLLGLSGSLTSSRAMFDRVFAYLDLETSEDSSNEDHVPGDGLPEDLWLVLRDVRYQYPGADQAAVRYVSLDIPPRSFTVIAGHSGSGKSTLALLAAGLLPPDSGSVRARDGLEDDGLEDSVSTRAAVTLVPQDAVLFNSTIRENLLFANPRASDRELDTAARLASLTGLLAGLPASLDTPVGERGYQMSGGERQRIALARALLSGSPILVVDETTASLDGHTADEIYQQLHEVSGHRTVIMITHRIPHLAAGDGVVVMADGRVTEQGSHEELLSRRGAYFDLVATQSVAVPARQSVPYI
jgi:ATP-binding cassette, subfamily B, bacterial